MIITVHESNVWRELVHVQYPGKLTCHKPYVQDLKARQH